MRFSILIFTVAWLGFCSFIPLVSAPIKLADCSIYVSPNQPDSVTEAAEELKQHIKLATGNDLKITCVPSKENMIVLGGGKEAQKVNIEVSKLPYEGHRILTKNNNLYIVGRDIPEDGKTKLGGYSFGTLYGVYHFLNKVLGIEWPYPSPKGTYIPNLGKDFVLPELDITYIPKFQVRSTYIPIVWQRNPDFRMWLQRNYHKLPDSRKPTETIFGSADIPFTHSWFEMYPAKANDLFESADETFRKHPDYFWMNANGVRMKPIYNFSLCLSNPETLKDVAARYVKIAKARNLPSISISPNDGTSCECPNCKALSNDLSDIGVYRASYKVTKGYTPLYLNYYRAVCEAMAKECPDVICNGLIYDSYLYAPKPSPQKMPFNFIPWMAPVNISYGPTRLYEPMNQSWHKWLADWDGVFGSILYFGYDFYLNTAGTNIPWPVMPGVLKDTMRTLLQYNCRGLVNAGIPSIGSQAVNNWILMKLDFDPDADPEILVKDYFSKAFGPGGTEIQEIYRILEKNLKEYVCSVQGKMSYYVTPELLQAVYAKDWETIRRLYSRAKAAPKDEGQQWRFDTFNRNMGIVEMMLVKMGIVKEDKASPMYLSDNDFHSLLARYDFGKDLEFYVTPMYYSSNKNNIRKVKTHPEKIRSAAPYNPPRMFLARDFVFYAPRDMEICLTLEQGCCAKNPVTGKAYLPAIPFFQVLDSEKKCIYEGLADLRDGTVRFPAKKGQHYYLLFASYTSVEFSPYFRILKSNAPYAIGTYIQPNGFSLRDVTTPVTFYLNVPENVKKFNFIANIYSSGHYRLVSPDGKILVENRKCTGYHPHEINREKLNVPAGLYRIEVLHAHWGYLRFEGIPPFLILDPENALIVEELPGK